MSLSGSKSKTKASETFKKQEETKQSGVQTSSQSLNPWSLEQYNTNRTGILGTLDNYNQNSPYKAYSGPLTAGLTDAERQARARVQQAGRMGQPGGGAAPMLSGQMIPYTPEDRPDNNSNGLLGNAADMISRASNAGPNLTEAAKVEGLMGYNPQQYGGTSVNNAATVNAPNIGKANTFDAAMAGSAQIGAMDQIGNRMGEIGKYMNPELERVVGTSLASYDEDAARSQAQMKAQGAAAGAFGGSRFGVREGIFGADVARNRGMMEAGLRSNAYDRATGLLGSDVGTVNQGRIAQAGMNQQANMTNAAAENAARAANAAAANSRDSERAGYAFNANTFNAGAQNQRESERAQMAQQAGLFNTGAANDASRYGADVNNQGALTNAGYRQQANLTNAQAREQALGRQMQGAGLLANVQNQQFGQDMQVADSLRQMGMDERQIADLQILREMAQYDRQAADQLQRVQMQLQAQFGLLGAAPMLTDSRQTTDGTMTGTQSGTGSSTSKTSEMSFKIAPKFDLFGGTMSFGG